MSAHTVDVVVIGGGSAGYAAAIRARELGSSVVIVEADKLGGTCLHRGCVPTKALLHTAEVADVAHAASTAGVSVGEVVVDGSAARAFRDKIVAGKHKGLQGLIAGHGITVVAGYGVLAPDRVVTVGDDTYAASHVVIATGSHTRLLPGIEPGPRVWTSETALSSDVVPARAIVLGGGVIGVEFASAWRSLGAEVTIVEALDHLVAAEDASSVAQLERAFRRRGIQTRLGVRVATVAETADAASVTLEDGTVLEGDVVLVAVGRAPHTADLGLEQAGVALERGFVVVDDQLRTTVPGVWAAGDVVAGLQLAHRGFQHGLAVAERIHGRTVPQIPDASIPRVIYTHPEVASVGLTEERAKETWGAEAIATVEYNLAGNAKSTILGTSGVAKVVRRVNGPVVGVHLVGDRVGELITEAQLVVGWEAHPEDIAPFVHAHPTQGEALGEAFLALAGSPLHVA